MRFPWNRSETELEREMAHHLHELTAGNRIGPLDERHKTVRELLNIIAERSRGGMWVGLHGPQWEFIEYQRPEDQGASMLRWITNLAR